MNEFGKETGAPSSVTETELQLILARCAILTGICRFIPVPFLDDIVAERVRKHLISSLLRLHRKTKPASHYGALYKDGSASCLGSAFGFGRGLILKPIKKLFRTIFFFLTIRDASLQMTRVYLLGRAFDACLRFGHLKEETDTTRMAAAFGEAFRGTDRRFLVHLMRQAGRGLRPLRAVGERALRRIFGQKEAAISEDGDRLAQLTPEERARLELEAERLATQLEQPEVVSFLADFDRRFLECFARMAQPPG